MLPDRVSNPGPLTYESGALPSALHRPAVLVYEPLYKVNGAQGPIIVQSMVSLLKSLVNDSLSLLVHIKSLC